MVKNTSKKHSNPKNTSVCRAKFLNAPKIVLTTIILTMIVVVIAIVCSFLLVKENVIKNKISALASDYYENYFYPKFTSSSNYQKIDNLDTTMAKYRDYGFSPISLRDLLLYDDQKNASERTFLTDNCDENKTFIKFYLEPPYDKASYHTEYTYSCNF